MTRLEHTAWYVLICALAGTFAHVTADWLSGGPAALMIISCVMMAPAMSCYGTELDARRRADARHIASLENELARDDYLLRPRRERAEQLSAHFIRFYDNAGRLWHQYDDGRKVLVRFYDDDGHLCHKFDDGRVVDLTHTHHHLGGITG